MNQREFAPPADIAIIGAGAAGLAAAIFAGEEAAVPGRKTRIILLDGARKPGAKILVSGGGRCNVTNEAVTPADYCGGSPAIIRNVLRQFDEHQTRRWMEGLGVDLKLEPTGKYFPVSDSARTVLDALMNRAAQLGIEMHFGNRVEHIAPAGGGWIITRAPDHAVVRARVLIVATGGRALPKSGSDGASYAWLQALGHTVVSTVPALAPLMLDERGVTGSPISARFADLSGITVDAILTCGSAVSRGSLLFTHFGLSGPAAMNLSRHIARERQARPDAAVPVTLGFPLGEGKPDTGKAPARGDYDAWLQEQARAHPQVSVLRTLTRLMPERIAAILAGELASQRMSDVRREDRLRLAGLLAASPLAVKGDRGYSFAEATAGGVSLDEISWKTMASRKADNLYLCGEVLDVDGKIGGFNFQWAWATGYVAGRAAVRSLAD